MSQVLGRVVGGERESNIIECPGLARADVSITLISLFQSPIVLNLSFVLFPCFVLLGPILSNSIHVKIK